MNLEWCCEEFRGHLFPTNGKDDGLGITVVIHSRIALMFLLEYRRPGRKPDEPIAEAGLKLKFCPGADVT